MAEQRTRSPFSRMSDRAKRAFGIATGEAVRLRYRAVEPEHLVLGLIGCDGAVTKRVFQAAGVGFAKAQKDLESTIGPGDATEVAEGLWPSPETKMIADRAAEEADRLGVERVEPEHLLLALAGQDGRAATALRLLGISPDAIRREIEGS
jgi:ATP-dependent Clp protease ATP-binding subunit ClpC